MSPVPPVPAVPAVPTVPTVPAADVIRLGGEVRDSDGRDWGQPSMFSICADEDDISR